MSSKALFIGCAPEEGAEGEERQVLTKGTNISQRRALIDISIVNVAIGAQYE